MKHLEKLSRKRLGEILVDEGLIAHEHLAEIQEEHEATGRPMGAILVAANLVSEWDLAKTVCSQYQLPYLELDSLNPGKSVLERFKPDEILSGWFMPIDDLGNVITLAVPELPDMDFLREIESRTGMVPYLFVSLLSQILQAQERLLGANAMKPPQEEVDLEIEPPEEEDFGLAPAEALDHVLPDDAGGSNGREAREEVHLEEEIKSSSLDDGDWSSLFDNANASVLKEIDRE